VMTVMTHVYPHVLQCCCRVNHPSIVISSHRGNLEREMKLLFGPRLRAEGGDGTLNLDT
jgi:hypothetical protein